jgi:hypothetical protein
MEKEKKIVSFDFDGTLNEHFMGGDNPHEDEIKQLFVELFNSDDFDVYIITRRFGPNDADKGVGNEHTTVDKMLKELNIDLPEEKKLFTNRSYKYKLINELGVDIHLDDDKREHQFIKKFTSAGSVDVTETEWRKEFDELLK